MSSFLQGPAFPGKVYHSGEEAVDDIYNKASHVFAVIARDMNANVVVLEAKVANHSIVGIEPYWLLLEASYQRNKPNHREPLNMLDHQAYGFESQRVHDREWIVKMSHLNDYPVTVRLEPDGSVNAYINLDNQLCMVHHVWVKVGKALHLFPRVDSVEVVGRTRDHKEIRKCVFDHKKHKKHQQ